MRAAIILAAGKGVRMKSDLPKVFHNLAGKPMLSYVLEAVKSAGVDRIFLVVGHKSELIKGYFKNEDVVFVDQRERRGTGHAVAQVEPDLKNFSGTVVVLAGDMPLIKSTTIKGLISFHERSGAGATVLTARVKDPFGYGRIVREAGGEVLKIVEERDATAGEKKIDEVNTGIYCFDSKALFNALKEVKAENDQKEYYLTDTIGILRNKNLPVFAFPCSDPREAMGVNTKEELETVEKMLLSKS